MFSYHLGVGLKKRAPCGGELIRPHGNRVLKLGRGEVFPREPHQIGLFRTAQSVHARVLEGLAQCRGGHQVQRISGGFYLYESGLNQHPQVERRINPVGVLKIFRETALRGEGVEPHAPQQNNIARRHLKQVPAIKFNVGDRLKCPLRNGLRRGQLHLCKPRPPGHARAKYTAGSDGCGTGAQPPQSARGLHHHANRLRPS